jgi:hypothetical protein
VHVSEPGKWQVLRNSISMHHDIALLVDEQVETLEVSMENFVLDQILHPHRCLVDNDTCN